MVKIINKYIGGLLIISILIALSYSYSYGSDSDLLDEDMVYTAKIIDTIDLYTTEEEKVLTDEIINLEEKHNINILIITIDDTDGYEAHEYAGEVYDKIHKINSDGIVLILNPEERIIGISTSGNLLIRINDDKAKEIREEIIDSGLKLNEFYNATLKFLEETDKALDSSIETEKNVNFSNGEKKGSNKFKNLNILHYIIPIIISGVISSLFYYNIKKSYNGYFKSEKFNIDANSSTNFTREEDVLIDTYITSVKSSDSKGSGKSGGNYTSSRGGRHGGGSSRY